MKRLSRAIALTSTLFVDVTDRGGKPYILHCLTVMNKVSHLGEIAMISAVLHDVIEDTHYTALMLNEAGFTKDEVEIVVLLSKLDGETYEDFIDRLIESGNKTAMKIKMADIEHNSDITRLKGVRDKDFERIKKYNKSYLRLKRALAELKC